MQDKSLDQPYNVLRLLRQGRYLEMLLQLDELLNQLKKGEAANALVYKIAANVWSDDQAMVTVKDVFLAEEVCLGLPGQLQGGKLASLLSNLVIALSKLAAIQQLVLEKVISKAQGLSYFEQGCESFHEVLLPEDYRAFSSRHEQVCGEQAAQMRQQTLDAHQMQQIRDMSLRLDQCILDKKSLREEMADAIALGLRQAPPLKVSDTANFGGSGSGLTSVPSALTTPTVSDVMIGSQSAAGLEGSGRTNVVGNPEHNQTAKDQRPRKFWQHFIDFFRVSKKGKERAVKQSAPTSPSMANSLPFVRLFIGRPKDQAAIKQPVAPGCWSLFGRLKPKAAVEVSQARRDAAVTAGISDSSMFIRFFGRARDPALPKPEPVPGRWSLFGRLFDKTGQSVKESKAADLGSAK